MTRWLKRTTALAVALPALVFSSVRIDADLPYDSAYADSVIRLTEARLRPLLGEVSVDSSELFIVTSEAKFDSLAGGSIPDWGAGVAIPHRRRIVIKSPLILPGDKALGELVAHEYTHLALARRLGLVEAPRWLNEGMAMYLSAEWDWADNLAVGWATVAGNTVALGEIERLNRFGGAKAEIAYAESYLAFKYFLDSYGVSGLHILLDRLAAGQDIGRAMVAATGGDPTSFEKEFAKFLGARYNLLTVLFTSEMFWVILALLFVVGIVAARLRRRRRFAELDRYEQLHSTDFDYGTREKPDDDDRWD
jgi:hypothetical protein